MLFKPGALKYIINEIIRHKILLVAIQKVRQLNSGNIQSSNSIIFCSGLKAGRQEKGVGFVINSIHFF